MAVAGPNGNPCLATCLPGPLTVLLPASTGHAQPERLVLVLQLQPEYNNTFFAQFHYEVVFTSMFSQKHYKRRGRTVLFTKDKR